MKKELNDLKQYLLSEGSESAKDHLIFPLFKKAFGAKNFQKQSEADGTDIYIKGRLVVELKTKFDDWLPGFFQALHYQKKGLNFSAVCVIAHRFVGLWKIDKIPDFAIALFKDADAQRAPNEIGVANARKTNKGQKNETLRNAYFLLFPNEFEGLFLDGRLSEFIDKLGNLHSIRQQINPKNFVDKIERLKSFFENPMDAIHCFYTLLAYWDITSSIPCPPSSDPSHLFMIGRNGKSSSERIKINPRYQDEFRKSVEDHYVFTNNEVGLDIDYYFSRFDEVISKIDPEYTKQHGIFFTDINLSRFALWFVRHYFEKKLSDKYIVLDPAVGSGNLVTSWRRNHLKHKIVSELQPDLLKIIERRMREDKMHIKTGFTIVPKTTENCGLNFLQLSAREYFEKLVTAFNQLHLD